MLICIGMPVVAHAPRSGCAINADNVVDISADIISDAVAI
jgi:hypothetical protein